jgi:hypothetical protein
VDPATPCYWHLRRPPMSDRAAGQCWRSAGRESVLRIQQPRQIGARVAAILSAVAESTDALELPGTPRCCPCLMLSAVGGISDAGTQGDAVSSLMQRGKPCCRPL